MLKVDANLHRTSKLKARIREYIPPALIPLLRTLSGQPDPVHLKGRYRDWQSAADKAGGYDDDAIFSAAVSAASAVFSGEAVWERDTVLFDSIQYSYPVMAHLGRIAREAEGTFRVLDVGGGFGSVYHQYSRFFRDTADFNWQIYEQPRYAEYGQLHFSRPGLEFTDDLTRVNRADVALFSASLQYFDQPGELLHQIENTAVRNVIVDMVPITERDELITLQTVKPPIYSASYPMRIFSHSSFAALFTDFETVDEFESLAFRQLSNFDATYRGFCLRRKA